MTKNELFNKIQWVVDFSKANDLQILDTFTMIEYGVVRDHYGFQGGVSSGEEAMRALLALIQMGAPKDTDGDYQIRDVRQDHEYTQARGLRSAVTVEGYYRDHTMPAVRRTMEREQVMGVEGYRGMVQVARFDDGYKPFTWRSW